MPLITGHGFFRVALIVESIANLGMLPAFVLNPDQALSQIVANPLQVTPATRTLTAWFGGMLAALTVPLLLSFPNPAPGNAGQVQVGFRRATYMTWGAAEFIVGAIMVSQYFSTGDTGMTDEQMRMVIGNLVPFTILRVFVLAVKPHWMEGSSTSEKKRA